MDAGDSHEVGVGVNLSDRFDGGGANGDDGVFEEAAADEDDFGVGVVDEFEPNRRAMSDDRRLQLERQMPGDLPGGGATVEDDYLAGLDHVGSSATDGDL